MQILGTRRVAEPTFTMGDYAAVLRQSEELRDYLRCDLPLPDDVLPPRRISAVQGQPAKAPEPRV